MDFITLTKDVLKVEEITKLVSDESCGAISLFVGTTRNNFEGKRVIKLEYEAYNAMAEKEIKKICQICRTKWTLKNIAVFHRLGVVEVEEASIIVAVSSEHRRESLAAVSFLIDELKSSAPIWKKEIYADNESQWKENKECTKIKEEFMEEEINKKLEGDVKQEYIDSGINKQRMEIFETNEKDEDTKESISLCWKRKSDYENETYKPIKRTKIDRKFVQIHAKKEEIDRRIKAFKKRKREELNMLNIQEFCLRNPHISPEDSSARTSAIVLRSRGSYSHLKFTKVHNKWGPQTLTTNSCSSTNGRTNSTKSKELSKSDRFEETEVSQNGATRCSPSRLSSSSSGLPEAMEERVNNIEDYLHFRFDSSRRLSTHERIKALEDRILYLEGVSPEYYNNKVDRKCTVERSLNLSPTKTKLYAEAAYEEGDTTLEELDARMAEILKEAKQWGKSRSS